ncbi:MAG: citrate synthase [Candidatus Bathyarchaeota archaeon]|nr:citrate/2-methylcitrate synthase [Candidatus Bathyarchaeum tardum]WGM89357.1 MAG: citrate/2-methylcitrate synthase [Candidatus Bathyarchaeum tardum]WNZ28369.1 MAG: citrate synthase [Candidatus Bathyarchaeota archaeon]
MSNEKEYVRGLRDVAACQTRNSFVDPLGALYYVGYDIDRLLGRVCYEEVVYLLLHKRLPTETELKEIKDALFSEMNLPDKIIESIQHSPKTSHPMEILRTSISQLGEFDPDPDDVSEASSLKRGLSLIAKVPTLVAAIYRLRNDLEPVEPKKDYSFAENFLYMFRGKPADKEEIESIERYMILHADHGLNASAFAARVTASTFSDMYSAVTSAVGTLKGKLHGGASERVMNMLLDVSSGEVEAYIRGMLFDHQKIMGFGHRVYVSNDPRSRHLRTVSKALCERKDRMDLYRTCRKIQAVVHKEKNIYPNVDFYAALVLNALDIPKEFFTLFFAASRITGWTAHILEQYSDSVLLRPTSSYIGAYGTKFVPIKKRRQPTGNGQKTKMP